MIPGVLGLLLPGLAAWLWSGVLFHRARRDSTVRAVLAFGAGVGGSSMTTMWLVLGGVPIGPRFVVIDAVLWGAVAAAGGWFLWTRSTAARAVTSTPPSIEPRSAVYWLVRIVFAVVACLAAAVALRENIVWPHGEWDAWAVWNHKARFFVRGGERWTDHLSILWANPSHPLLVPLTVARLWAYAGAELTAIPAALAAMFGFGSAAIVIGTLGPHRDRAWIAGAVILGPGKFLQDIMTQQADVPLGFFFVSALALAQRALTSPDAGRFETTGFLMAAGMLSGFAAWTKNEGLLFILAMIPAVLWIAISRGLRWRGLWWLLGATPIILTVIWHKAFVAPVAPPYVEAQALSSLMANLAGSERHALILPVMSREYLVWGGPYAAGVVVIALAMAVAAAIGSAFARLATTVLGLMILGYYGIYLLTQLDPVWLTQTTFHRVLTQLWPSLVLAAFSYGGQPVSVTPPVLSSNIAALAGPCGRTP